MSQVEAPTIVSSIDEMTDMTKHYILDGYIWHNKTIVIEAGVSSANLFVESSAIPNARLSGSSGSVTANGSPGYFVTDYIKVEKWSETTSYNVRLNWKWQDIVDDEKFAFYDSSKNRIGHSFIDVSNTSVVNEETIVDIKIIGKNQGAIPTNDADVAWVRFQIVLDATGASITTDDIVNANIEITFDANQVVGETTTKQEWVNSGISYTPTFKTDLIGVLGENNVIYLSDNLPSGTYTLKYPDNDYETIGTVTK